MVSNNGQQSNIASLLSRMQDLASITDQVESDQSTRAQLLQLSKELTASLEQPDEVVSLVAFSVSSLSPIAISFCNRNLHTQGNRNMCVRIADDLNLFDILSDRSPNSISANELATISGAEVGLILRLLRTLVGMGFASQTGNEEFAATHVSKHMTKESVRAGVRFL